MNTFTQGVKVGTLGRQNERNSSYVRLAHTSIFGLCFMMLFHFKKLCSRFYIKELKFSNFDYMTSLSFKR